MTDRAPSLAARLRDRADWLEARLAAMPEPDLGSERALSEAEYEIEADLFDMPDHPRVEGGYGDWRVAMLTATGRGQRLPEACAAWCVRARETAQRLDRFDADVAAVDRGDVALLMAQVYGVAAPAREERP